jgi:hypothetical protein
MRAALARPVAIGAEARLGFGSHLDTILQPESRNALPRGHGG